MHDIDLWQYMWTRRSVPYKQSYHMIISILILIAGLFLLSIPLYKLVLSCKSASDITWTLGQAGGMKNGIIFYVICAIAGGALAMWGVLRLLS